MRTAIGLPLDDATGISECLDRLAAEKHSNRPVSTYRLQFNEGFTFEDARRLIPFFHALGVTHCYASPILKARQGSQHGYDITDHNAINPEIGTPQEFEAFVCDLKAQGMGLILDTVPNHMGVGHGTNPWWQDVLENGESSEHADFFDIDWRPLKTELRGKVLLPILGASYGDELEQGHLQLSFENGSFFVAYYDKCVPMDPRSYPIIFDEAGDLRDRSRDPNWRDFEYPELQSLIGSFRELPSHFADDPELKALRRREIPKLKEQLAQLAERSANVRKVIDEAIRLMNGTPGQARSFDSLHRLLEEQAYRLAHWRVSAEEINYRRFFDINDLVGLRMENPAVFAETHRLIRKLLAEGAIDGIRLDHTDGLYNPVQYFTRLQMLYAASHCCGPEPRERTSDNGIEQEVLALFSEHDWIRDRAPLYVIVEKILEHGEHLPRQWPVDGTVGYEFGNALNHLFIQGRHKRVFTNLYHRFIGGPIEVDTLIYTSKKMIMRSSLSSELTVLTHILEEISRTDRKARDFTRPALADTIRETIACFPVYRTYIDARGNVSERDRGYIQEAIARAKRRNQSKSPAMYDFLRGVLLLDTSQTPVSAEQYRNRLRFTLKFQQLTGPVMAKGLEDTACYVYSRFISANEVGGSPAAFGISKDEFHQGNQERLKDWPFGMLGTSTHDSKRSEDMRARLNVISEMPREWASQAIRWRRANKSKKKALSDGRVVPDANEEYFLYQTLVGSWPFSMESAAEREEFTLRMQDYMTKAVHEAKVNLSWINQNPEYVDALRGFIERILKPGKGGRVNTFLQQMANFLPRVQMFGAVNALAQVVLKIASPGVPDIYRGCELWDLSLVDPDNRRPVDYDLRSRYLEEMQRRASGGQTLELCDEMVRNYADGRIKLWTTARSMNLRREHPDIFQTGSYVPLSGSNAAGEHTVAFIRQKEWRMVVAVVPRFAYTLMKGEPRMPIGPEVWGDAELELPTHTPIDFQNVMTGETVRSRGGKLLCREVLAHFPVALLAAF